MKGRVVSVNVSERKHVVKKPVAEAEFRTDHGLVGDAHARGGERQVSLLALEAIEVMKQALEERGETCPKAGPALSPGAFAENVTTEGVGLPSLPIGTRLAVGDHVVLEISKIGKKCHQHCEIFELLGDCVMPREGVFARVVVGGVVRPGDGIETDESGCADSK